VLARNEERNGIDERLEEFSGRCWDTDNELERSLEECL
jgi:hypothetical protein